MTDPAPETASSTPVPTPADLASRLTPRRTPQKAEDEQSHSGDVNGPQIAVQDQPEATTDQPDPASDPETPETAARDAVIASLRAEAASNRVKLREATERADKLAHLAVRALVEADARVIDPDVAADLVYEDALTDGMPDRERVSVALDALLEAKPYLRKIKVSGDIGQGITSDTQGTVSLLSLMKGA